MKQGWANIGCTSLTARKLIETILSIITKADAVDVFSYETVHGHVLCMCVIQMSFPSVCLQTPFGRPKRKKPACAEPQSIVVFLEQYSFGEGICLYFQNGKGSELSLAGADLAKLIRGSHWQAVLSCHHGKEMDVITVAVVKTFLGSHFGW